MFDDDHAVDGNHMNGNSNIVTVFDRSYKKRCLLMNETDATMNTQQQHQTKRRCTARQSRRLSISSTERPPPLLNFFFLAAHHPTSACTSNNYQRILPLSSTLLESSPRERSQEPRNNSSASIKTATMEQSTSQHKFQLLKNQLGQAFLEQRPLRDAQYIQKEDFDSLPLLQEQWQAAIQYDTDPSLPLDQTEEEYEEELQMENQESQHSLMLDMHLLPSPYFLQRRMQGQIAL